VFKSPLFTFFVQFWRHVKYWHRYHPLVWHKPPQIWNGSWPSSSGLRGRRRTCHTILKLADHALIKMVRILWPLRPELDNQDPFQSCGGLYQTRKTPTLALVFEIPFCRLVFEIPNKYVYKSSWYEFYGNVRG
jgi:hypothetical protein